MVMVFTWISFVLMLVSEVINCAGDDKQKLYAQIIVSQESDFDFSGYIPAIKLALKLINDERSGILPNYTLEHTEIINSKCSSTPGVHGFIDHVTKPKMNMTEIIIIGADCSVSTQPIASLAPLWNLVQVSIDSSSPRLSDTDLYPLFVRPVPPDDSISPAIVALMKYFDWKYLAIVTQEEDLFTLTREALLEAVKKSNFETVFSSAFPTGQSPQNIVENLKKSSGRIIFLNTYPEYALEILCQASTLGMTNPDYAWISFGWYFDDFWNGEFQNRTYDIFTQCTKQQLKDIVNRMFMVNTYPELDENDSQIMIGNLSLSQYEDLYREEWRNYFNNTNYSSHPNDTAKTAFGYDATWLAAQALHGAEEELRTMDPPRSLLDFFENEEYQTETKKSIQDLIYHHARITAFNGSSGYFNVLENGDRPPELTFSQYREYGQTLKRIKIVGVDSDNTLIFKSGVLPLFEGQKPQSHLHESIHIGLFITFSVLAGAGVLFAVACLIFNLVYRKKQIVKLSSPYLNVVFISGNMMTYLLVIVLGIDDNLVDMKVMNGLCQVPVWIGVIAFTLIYGVVLAKTFKVFFIIKNLQVSRPDKKRVIQDWHMFLLIGILLLIDIIFLTIVTAIPQAILTVKLVELPLVAGQLPTETNLCTSATSHIWGPILLVYKAVELVFSLIFAFETRKIKVKELNDSRMVIFSVYTIVVAGIAVAPVIALLSDRVTIRYAVTGIICLATATVLLGINFIPMMHSLRRHPSGEKQLNFASLAGGQLSKSQAVPMTNDQVTQVQRSSQLSAIREEDSVIGNSVVQDGKEEAQYI
jgi:gamma-aminobutyric acid type B receptor